MNAGGLIDCVMLALTLLKVVDSVLESGDVVAEILHVGEMCLIRP